jgi:hypothetical protein
MKVLFGMALRQTTGFVESLLRLVGRDWDVPDFSPADPSSEDRCRQHPASGGAGSAAPLIDIEPVSANGSSEPTRDAVRVAQPDPSPTRISPASPQTGPNTRKCHDVIYRTAIVCLKTTRRAERDAAVILPDRNAKPWKADRAEATARNETRKVSTYLGCTLWRRWSGDHRRSRAETQMQCVTLLGQSLVARDIDHRVAVFQDCVAVLKGCTAPGVLLTKIVRWASPGKGAVRPSAVL